MDGRDDLFHGPDDDVASPIANVRMVDVIQEDPFLFEFKPTFAAVQIVAETQRVSISYLQRRLGVGYNRAAKLVERMERDQVVGP